VSTKKLENGKTRLTEKWRAFIMQKYNNTKSLSDWIMAMAT